MSAEHEDTELQAEENESEESEKREKVIRTVANVSEPVFSATSAGIGALTIARAAIGTVPILAPMAGIAVTGLLPVVIAAAERLSKARSKRSADARNLADAAWDMITETRRG